MRYRENQMNKTFMFTFDRDFETWQIEIVNYLFESGLIQIRFYSLHSSLTFNRFPKNSIFPIEKFHS